MPVAPRDDIIDQPGVFPPTSLVSNLPQPGAAPPPGGDISPTALIHQYLAARGLQPTAANVSAALMQNSREPGTIAGLMNQAPPEAGGGGGAGGAGGGRGLPIPPMPPGKQGPGQDATVDMPHPELAGKPSDAIVDQPGTKYPTSGPSSTDIAMSALLAAGLGGGGYGGYQLAQIGKGDGRPPAAIRAEPEPTRDPALKEKEKPAEVVKASEEGARAQEGKLRQELNRGTSLTPVEPVVIPPGTLAPPPTATVEGGRVIVPPKPRGGAALRALTRGRV